MRTQSILLAFAIAAGGLQSAGGAVSLEPSATRSPFVVPARFRTVDDTLAGLKRIRNELIARQDRRAIFATAYLETTTTFRDWIRQRRFESNERMEKYVVAFANAYRQALEDYERGEAAPEAWRLAFDACRSDRSTVTEHLLLGINAHINHDLTFAILSAGLDVRSESCHRDHLRANEALREATPRVRQQVVAIFRPPGAWMSRVFARRIDEATASSFVHARNNSWAAATAIATAPSRQARNSFRRAVKRCSAVAAARIQANKNSPGRSLELMGAANDSLSSARPRIAENASHRRAARVVAAQPSLQFIGRE